MGSPEWTAGLTAFVAADSSPVLIAACVISSASADDDRSCSVHLTFRIKPDFPFIFNQFDGFCYRACDPPFCPLSVQSVALRNGHRQEKYDYRMTYAMGGMREAEFPSTMVPATSPSGVMSRPPCSLRGDRVCGLMRISHAQRGKERPGAVIDRL